jgi:hypothetical protein
MVSQRAGREKLVDEAAADSESNTTAEDGSAMVCLLVHHSPTFSFLLDFLSISIPSTLSDLSICTVRRVRSKT